ncbi:hypothetical protein [Yinghuangia soli]|uniref:Uncharacterized protein n=1 Tax=Yinghuangia soli TaxID=2908204 RepID=A0AA41Q690_9ACTN|nr:hypothetical protein [Yinghuangia soli]MCF2531441.1 hypothetical protein [Yinghuangia soli]
MLDDREDVLALHRPVRPREPRLPVVELAFADGDLVTQSQDLGIFVAVADGQQPQRGERVRHGEVGESAQHS